MEKSLLLKISSHIVSTALIMTIYCAGTALSQGTKPVSGTTAVPGGASTSAKIENLIKERYLNYHQTLLKANSFDEIAPLRSTKLQAELETKKVEAQAKDADTQRKMMDSLLSLAKALEPKNIIVTNVVVKGDTAELAVSATDSGEFPSAMTKGFGNIASSMGTALGGKSASKPMRSTTTGNIKMLKEDGNWLVGEESWSTNVTNLTPAQEASRNAEDARKKSLSS